MRIGVGDRRSGVGGTGCNKGTRLVDQSWRTRRWWTGYWSSEEDFNEAINNAPEYLPGVLYSQGVAGTKGGSMLNWRWEWEVGGHRPGLEVVGRRLEVIGWRTTDNILRGEKGNHVKK